MLDPFSLMLVAGALAPVVLSRPRRLSSVYYTTADALGLPEGTRQRRRVSGELVERLNRTAKVLDILTALWWRFLEHIDAMPPGGRATFALHSWYTDADELPHGVTAPTGYRVVVQCASSADASLLVQVAAAASDSLPVAVVQQWGDHVVIVADPEGYVGAGSFIWDGGQQLPDDEQRPDDASGQLSTYEDDEQPEAPATVGDADPEVVAEALAELAEDDDADDAELAAAAAVV